MKLSQIHLNFTQIKFSKKVKNSKISLNKF